MLGHIAQSCEMGDVVTSDTTNTKQSLFVPRVVVKKHLSSKRSAIACTRLVLPH